MPNGFLRQPEGIPSAAGPGWSRLTTRALSSNSTSTSRCRLHSRSMAQSPNGVRTCETVTVRLRPDYPWSSPSFYLRKDFPQGFPTVQPGPLTDLPRPCLVDGNQREYFFQFGLVELGVFKLLHQLVKWLQRAAEGTLIHHGRGWEPTLRRDLSDVVAIDAENCRATVDRQGGTPRL